MGVARAGVWHLHRALSCENPSRGKRPPPLNGGRTALSACYGAKLHSRRESGLEIGLLRESFDQILTIGIAKVAAGEGALQT